MQKGIGMKYCAQCKAGENKVEADYRVKGKIFCGDRMMPYKAYICMDHLTMLEDDGAELKVTEYLNKQAIERKVQELLDNHTGYVSINNFLHANPTLKPHSFPGAGMLRKFYKDRTGKAAHR